MTKYETVRIIQQMPEKFELDDLIERLIVVENINVGIQQVEAGDIIPHSEMKIKFEEWKRKQHG